MSVTPQNYRKKPVIVQAIQYTGNNLDAIAAFAGESMAKRKDYHSEPAIYTLEGAMAIGRGDYIIRGTRGEIYPCKPDVFSDVYELVERRDDGTGSDMWDEVIPKEKTV